VNVVQASACSSSATGRERTELRLHALLIAAFAIGLAFCSPAIAGGAEPPHAHLLSYIVKESTTGGERYIWKFWDPDTDKQAAFLDLPDKPKLVIWDAQNHLVYYAIGGHIFGATYPRTYALSTKITDLPPSDVPEMWIERTTGRLRVIARDDVPGSGIIKKANGNVIFRLADGSAVAAPPHLPDWGTPAVLTVLELNAHGRWVRIARRATKYGAGDTPGSLEVKDFWHEQGASQRNILMSYTCAYGESCGRNLPKSFFPALHAAGNYTPADFNYFPASNGWRGIVFQTIEGDTVHQHTPVFTFSQKDPKLVRLESLPNDERVGLGRSGRYLLIAEEYTGDNPVVIDLKTGRVAFSEAALSAVWIP